MVHQKLISEGKVAPLTYKQLRRIEKIEAKGKRDEQLLTSMQGAGTAAIYEFGEIIKAGVTGSFKVAEAIAGNSDPISQGIAIVGGVAALSWFATAFPGVAKAFHLDTLAFQTGNPPAPPVSPSGSANSQPNPSAGNTVEYPYVVTFTYFNPFDYKWDLMGREAFKTAADRDAWIASQGSRIEGVKTYTVSG